MGYRSVLLGRSCCRRLVAACLLAALLVAGCGSGTEPTNAGAPATAADDLSTNESVPTEVATTEGSDGAADRAELGHGFRRCDELLSTGLVDGPLSSDPGIAEAQQFRADMGLRSDETWVRQVPTMERTSEMADAFGYPLTDEEVTDLTSWRASVDTGGLDTYTAGHRDTFGGFWIDNAARAVTVSFSAEVETRRAEIGERWPAVRVVAANLDAGRLTALQNELMAQLVERGLGGSSGQLIQAAGGVVNLGLFVLDEASVAAVAEFADPALTCLEGQELNVFTAPGPQAGSGPGWRLLGLEEADVPFQAVTGAAGLEQLWAAFAPGRPAPPVDFGTEIVLAFPTFGTGIQNGPCGSRFDGFSVGDDGVVRLDLPAPGGAAGCDAIAIPGAYVLAFDRSALPDGTFTVEIVRRQYEAGPLGSISVTL